MEELVIRHADPVGDAAGCAAVYAPYVLASATSFEETAPDEAEMADRIAQTSTTHPWLVAERGGKLLGYAYACRHRERPAYRWSADVSVYVNKGQWRQGVGRRLYKDLFEHLRHQGFRTACAGITLPNVASVALHERLGFVPVGVYRRIGWKAEAWRDVGWWQLELTVEDHEPPADPLGPDRS
ncbi:MAG TPA: arsinothricin resistance N-acetyltransferase ArsN1 family B [Solirubrobacterales bacterium]|nr:arsinothricin resistance N-acetyltransferase ArsN1 family B [Solirubrobacterales bacterium]